MTTNTNLQATVDKTTAGYLAFDDSNVQVEASIRIDIDGQKLNLTFEQLVNLRDKLEDVFSMARKVSLTTTDTWSAGTYTQPWITSTSSGGALYSDAISTTTTTISDLSDSFNSIKALRD